MPKSPIGPQRRVTVLLLPNMMLSTIAAPCDVFGSVGVLENKVRGLVPQPLFDVSVVTFDGEPVSSQTGPRLMPDGAMGDVKSTDLIIVPGVRAFPGDKELLPMAASWLRGHHEKGAHLASICTGSFLLAATGLLDGRRATTHWAVVDTFRRTFPQVKLEPRRIITDLGDIFCSGGVDAGVDLCLYLVSKYCGREKAREVARLFVHDIGRESQSPYETSIEIPRRHSDEEILRVQRYIDERFSENLSLEVLAQHVGMSQRTFERKFKAATGDTPVRYLQSLRVEAAKRLLERGGETFERITYAVGYEDPSSFRRLFIRRTGLTPTAYRSRFGLPSVSWA